MGRTRVDAPKVKNQCLTCGEWNGDLHNKTCNQGISVICRRQSKKKCPFYRRPSVFEAARNLAESAGINMSTIEF